jgi:predicted  nucleic acid-binding Zn-ribbon protein
MQAWMQKAEAQLAKSSPSSDTEMLRCRVSELRETLTRTERDLTDSKSTTRDLQRDLNEQTKLNAALKADLVALNTELEDVKTKAKKDLLTLSNQRDESDRLATARQGEIIQLQQENQSLHRRIEPMQADVQRMRMEVSQASIHRAKATELHDDLLKTQKELDTYKTTSERNALTFNALKERLHKAEEQLGMASGQAETMDKLQARVDRAKAKNKQLRENMSNSIALLQKVAVVLRTTAEFQSKYNKDMATAITETANNVDNFVASTDNAS